MNAGAATCATTVFLHCTTILKRSSACMAICTGCLPLVSSHVQCPNFPNFPPLKPPQLAGQGGPFKQRAAWLDVHLSSQWSVGPLRVSSVPKMGAPSLTHFSRSARDWLITSQSHATAPIRPAATQLGPLLSLGQLRQSHPVSAIFGPGSHSQLQVHRSRRRHWLADWVGERASASAMACRIIADCKGQSAGGWVSAFYRGVASPLPPIPDVSPSNK